MNTFLRYLNLSVLLAGLVLILTGYYHHELHPVLGFLYAILFIGTVILTMFYFITTGAMIKEEVQSKNLDANLYQQTRQIKKYLFPPIFLSAVLIVTSGIYGGAVNAGISPGWMHSIFSFSAWIMLAWSFSMLHRLLQVNKDILLQVRQRNSVPGENSESA